MNKQNTTILQVMGLVLIFTLFFFLRWNSFSMPFERDEGEYAYSAWILSTGDLPYENSFLQKPPLIVYLYFLANIINSHTLWPPRLLSFISLSGVILLVYFISKKEFGLKNGLVAALLSTVMLSIPIITPFAANTENFLILPLMVFVGFFVFYKNRSKWHHFLISGVFAALTLLFKPIAIFVCTFILVYWLYLEYTKDKIWKNIAIHFLAFITGGLITTVIILIPFLGSGMAYFYETAINFNRLYANHWGFGLSHFFGWLLKFIKYWWVIIPFVFAFFYSKKVDTLFWVGCLLTALLGVYQTPIGHYYILVMPFLAIIVSHGINVFVEHFKKVNLFAITLLVVAIMVWPFTEQLGKTPQELGVWVYGTANPFTESKLVAEEVRKITNEKDYVFVAGSEPQIYYYAKRKSPTRFVITYPLIINTPLMEKYQNEAKDSIQRNKPQVIVYSQRQFSGLWEEGKPTIFVDYLHKLLNEEYSIKGMYIWEENGKGHWIDKFDQKDLQKASLILYKLK